MSKILLRLVAVGITGALFVWLLSSARWQDVGRRLSQFDPGTLLIAASLFAASYLLRAARVFDEFRHETRSGAASVGFASLHFLRFLRLTLIHNALVNVAPLRAGEIAFPVLLKRWFKVPAERSIVALLWLRIQDAIVVLVLAACVWPGMAAALRALVILAIVAAAFGIPLWAQRHGGATDKERTDDREAGESPADSPADLPTDLQNDPQTGRTPGRLAKFRAALARSTRSQPRSWLWTLANWTVKLSAETWLLMGLLGVAPNVGALGALGAELAGILPIQGVAGFGTFEAGAAALMRTYNVGLVDGLQAALALHLIMLGCAMLAGGLAAAFMPEAPTA